MVNLYETMKGNGAFVAGIIAIYLLTTIFPLMITPLSDMSDDMMDELGRTTDEVSTPIEEAAWWFYIIISVALTIVLPIYFFYKGLTEEDEQQKGMIAYLIAAVYFLIVAALSYKGWFMVTAMATIVNGSTYTLVLFWTGMAITWIVNILVIPLQLIINADR